MKTKTKRFLWLLFSLLMVFGPVNVSAASLDEEMQAAQALGMIPTEWENDLSAPADFEGYYEIITHFVELVDSAAMEKLDRSLLTDQFPDREMRRDDALTILTLTAEAVGYNMYNAQEYPCYIEPVFNLDAAFAQLSWDYPYCAFEGGLWMYDKFGGSEEFPNVTDTGVFWMIRRMDLSQQKHFLDCDEAYDFHLDGVLTRRDAAASVLRLYNSEMLEYDPAADVVPSEETKAQPLTVQKQAELEAGLQAAIDAILTTDNEIVKSDTYIPGETYTGTAYYISNEGDDGQDGLTPETAWRTMENVFRKADWGDDKFQAGDAIFLRRGDIFRLPEWAVSISVDGLTFSAYGEGAKPILTSSTENGAGAEKWNLVWEDETGAKIWEFYKGVRDTAMVVLDDGEKLATRVYEYYDGEQYYDFTYEVWSMDVGVEKGGVVGSVQTPQEALTEDLTILSRPTRTGDQLIISERGPLYLRCDQGNPGELYHSIEFSEYEAHGLIWLDACNTVFDNISFRCNGNSYMKSPSEHWKEVENTLVQNCEFAYGGGSVTYYQNEGGIFQVIVQGDGIYTVVRNTTVRNNYFHDAPSTCTTYEASQDDNEPVSGYYHTLDNVMVNTFAIRFDSTSNALKYLDSLIIRGNQIWNTGASDHEKFYYAEGGICMAPNFYGECIIEDNLIYTTTEGHPTNALLSLWEDNFEAFGYTRPQLRNNVYVQAVDRNLSCWFENGVEVHGLNISDPKVVARYQNLYQDTTSQIYCIEP